MPANFFFLKKADFKRIWDWVSLRNHSFIFWQAGQTPGGVNCNWQKFELHIVVEKIVRNPSYGLKPHCLEHENALRRRVIRPSLIRPQLAVQHLLRGNIKLWENVDRMT